MIGEAEKDKTIEGYEKKAFELHALYQFLRARVPPLFEVPNDAFFKMSPCACCGKMPTDAKGHEVYDHKVNNLGVIVPVCTACLTAKREPQWEQIAKIYIAYALNLRYDIEDLHNAFAPTTDIDGL